MNLTVEATNEEIEKMAARYAGAHWRGNSMYVSVAFWPVGGLELRGVQEGLPNQEKFRIAVVFVKSDDGVLTGRLVSR